MSNSFLLFRQVVCFDHILPTSLHAKLRGLPLVQLSFKLAFEIHKKQKLFTPLPEWSGSIWWKEKSNKAVRKQIKFLFPNPEV